jgi:hypothetical protein
MEMVASPMFLTDWNHITSSKIPGDSGFVLSRTQSFGEIRIRMVEYSPGYAADHWCAKGHVILCLSGTIDIESEDGERVRLEAGQSLQVGDGDPAHRSSTLAGAILFIVD